VFDIVERWARTALPSNTLSFAAVQKEADIGSRQDFAQLRNSAALRNALANIGVFENDGKRRTRWVLVEPAKAPEAEFDDYFGDAA
jgi:hypothetical protein